jgi:hypothetical protein
MTAIRSLTAVLVIAVGMAAPAYAGDFPMADKVLVEKGKRQLHLLRNGTRTATISFPFIFPIRTMLTGQRLAEKAWIRVVQS